MNSRIFFLVVAFVALITFLFVYLLGEDPEKDQLPANSQVESKEVEVERDSEENASEPIVDEPTLLPPLTDEEMKTATVTGLVTDETGNPVPNAIVTLHLLAWQAGVAEPSDKSDKRHLLDQKTTTSDAQGVFAFEPLPRPHEIWITARNQEKSGFGQTRLLAVTRLNDIRVKIFTGSTVKGIIRDRSGRPLPNLTVTAFALDDWNPKASRELANGDTLTITDSEGRFEINGLFHGEFFLQIVSEDWVIDERPGFILADQSTKEFQLVAVKGLTIEGEIKDESRQPVAGASVLIKPEGGGWRQNKKGGTTMSDEKGYFRLAGLKPGNYTIFVQGSILVEPSEIGQESSRRPRAVNFKKKGVIAGNGSMEIILQNP